MKTKLTASAICGALLLSMTIQAVPDRDLDINGHFRGQAQDYSPAPGWTLTADGGNARILPGPKRGKFRLEIIARRDRSQSVVSDLHPVFGNTIEIEADICGRGNAAIGFEAFDSTGRQLVASDRQLCPLNGQEQCFKKYFPVNSAARHIRIRLTAEAGSAAVFRDVEAEMKHYATAAPVPGAIAAPPAPAPGTIAAPPAPAPAAVAAPAPAPAPVAAPPAPAQAAQPATMLEHHRYYSWNSLRAVEHFQVQLPVGSEIEFDLQEHRNRNLHWSVVRYDGRICRIKIDHDRDGGFPFRYDKAEFELKAIWRGTTTIELACGRKRVFIHFTAL